MSVDEHTVRRVARLARIAVEDHEVTKLKGELDAILAFVEELSALDVESVEPMTSVIPASARLREDVVDDGENPEAVLMNAPSREADFYVVPKVVE
ncbi:Asp-tRNA(Asn)/Glu-tRNA(Gln) amidotransferase subunit GatC [Hansschlegelia zhihuaiae]|uniref:Aspartyl/glutamyl-tRNA(Asn/Gln) amidotransferase subunit C n=1 Tax=Hansschlegelia zhihuaiae TaxID=405005 RepID=A0A4Q0MLN1_9HYPH|nr:Asp-tRNA(Asn)/Glu-tRNA(Gln) amidotransferase subunit GatC [Hansschlegelia zhihuaiae]RXF74641.1 Asp-tRNA(Asn)/Glu-tRNA(Gln) amidotransferase subunit GatC [Hansschlegelia zhihuaiae]